MAIQELIDSILDEAAKEGRPIPSLRSIRAKIGYGSLTTISEAVKSWRTRQMVDAGELPKSFAPDESAAVSAAVWQNVSPILQKRIEEIRRSAQDRIDMEMLEAQKLSQTAQEMLEEAESARKEFEGKEAVLNKALADSQSELNQTKGALLEARKEVEALRQELQIARQERDSAIKAAAAAEASAEAIRRLVPFLDPKHVTSGKAKK